MKRMSNFKIAFVFLFFALAIFLPGKKILATQIACNLGTLSCSASDTANYSCPSVPAQTNCICSGTDIPVCGLTVIPQMCNMNSPCGGAQIMYSPLFPEAKAWDTNCCRPMTQNQCTCVPAPSAVNGICGSSNGTTVTTAPTINLCSAGTSSSVTGTGPWNWTCNGIDGGSNASCSASPVVVPVVNGSCGSANGVALTYPPNSNLCNSGGASSVSGFGPWNWTCLGSGGGSNAPCSAPLNSNPALWLEVIPGLNIIDVGQTATYTITVHAEGIWQFFNYITLSTTNCPGTSCTFSKNNLVASPDFDGYITNPSRPITMTVTGAPAGYYNLKINADVNGGNGEHGDRGVSLKVGPPTCTSTGPTGVVTSQASGFLNVYAYGVSPDVTSVRFPTWGETNLQNDIVWYNGTNMGGGKWGAAINMANHAVGNPEYGNIFVHVYMYSALVPGGALCGTDASFIRVPPTTCNPATVGTNQLSGCSYNGTNFNTLIGGTITGPALSSPVPASATALPYQDWGGGGPNGLPSNFSVRWKGNFNFSAGTYSFRAGSDDGNRLYVDGNVVLDKWVSRPYTEDTVDVNFSADGQHTITYEYYQGGGGAAYNLSWAKIAAPTVDLKVNGQDTSSGAPLAIPRKDSSTFNLTWNVTGATSCTAMKTVSAPGVWTGAKNTASGNEPLTTINVAGSFRYVLSCTGAGGTTADTVYIDVPACNTLSFVSGSVSPGSVAPSGAYTVSCNYGAVNTQIVPIVGSGSCGGGTFTGTTANFNCTAGAVSNTFANSCSISSPPTPQDYYCASTDPIDNLTVSPATGTIAVRYAIDGIVQSTNQAITYSIAGPTAVASGSYTVNNTSSHTLRNIGSYTFTYTSGAPAGKTFSSVTPSVTQDLTAAGTITYTINFVTVAVAPTITLTPASFFFSGTSGGVAPAAQNLKIANTGASGSNLLYRVQTNQTWCKVNGVNNSGSITGGPLASNASTTVAVTMDAPSNAGGFTCIITVSDNGSSPAPTNSPQTRTVNYSVAPSNVTGVTSALTACPSVTISWNAANSGATAKTYTVYRNTVNNAGTSIAAASGIAGLTYVDSPPVGSTYYYWVKAVSGGRISASYSASVPASQTVSACAVNTAPIASATISKDGVTYTDAISVVQGQSTPIYLAASSAAGVSSDPEGWTHATFGMSGGTAKCDWNRDLNQTAPFFSGALDVPVNTPASATDCNISLGNLTFNDDPGTYTYSVLSLTDHGGLVSGTDTVQVTVTTPLASPPGGGGGQDPCVENGLNICGTNPPNSNPGAVACDTVKVAWSDNSTNENGFYVYIDTDNNVNNGYIQRYTTAVNATTQTITPPTNNTTYHYFVSSFNAGGESAIIPADDNPISAQACVANLTTSDKDIVAINGAVVPSTGSCNGTDPLPANTQLNLGNKVKFSINLCNSGTLPATGISVTDSLTNLIKPSTGWKAMYDDGSGEVPIATAGISLDDTGGTDPNKILKFTNIPDVPVAPVIPPAVRRITFEAQLSVPINYSATSARFQNRFTVTYNAGVVPKLTPLILFYTGKGIPTVQEVP